MTILFDEELHKYFYKEAPELKLTSVSKIIEMYHEEFDTEKVAEKTAAKRGVTKESLIEEWKKTNSDAIKRGHAYHFYKEQKYLKQGKINGLKVFAHETDQNLKKGFDITKLVPGIYPELIVDLPEFQVIGTADYIEIFEDGTFILEDHKGFPLDTLVPTPTGFKKIEDLILGDEVFDGNGEITNVSAVSQIHHKPCYKITFDSNESIVCDYEHRWLVNSFSNPEEKVMTAEEIFNMKSIKKLRIRNVSVKSPEKELPIDPYVLGCWLGDGNRCYSTITNMNDLIWEEIRKRGYFVGEDVSNKKPGMGCGKAQTKTVYGISKHLRDLNLTRNKHLPDIYLLGSHEQRLDLLRGFMDTDGHFNRGRNRNVMTTTQEWQADAIVNLVSSLGGKATKMPSKTSGFGKINIPAFNVCFRLIESPYLCKNFDYVEHMKDVKIYKSAHRYFKKIEKVEMVPTKCIQVSSDTHAFLVTKKFLLTHNTNGKLESEGFKVWDPVSKTKKSKMMYAPISHIHHCNLGHYSIQLSIYAFALEEAGFNLRPNGLTINHVLFDEDGTAVDTIPYKLNYLKKEVKNLLNHFKQNHLPKIQK